MADDQAEIDRIVAEQRATPEDLKPQADPPAQAPIETAPEAANEAEGDAEVSADGDVAQPAAEAEPPAKKKKGPTDYLTGRIGNLNQRLTERETALASALARAEAAERLLNARGTPAPADGEQPPTPAPARTDTNPQTGRVYTQAEFEAALAEQVPAVAARQEFDRQANELYQAGETSFPDWKENVEVLNASGIMSKDLVDATLALGDQKIGAAVMHQLGSDLEEANRIAQLPPVKMGVELAKIAAQVSQPAPPVRVSSAPAPIPTIRGRVEPTVDFAKAAEGDNDMSAYVAARKKAGDPFAMGRAERAAAARGR